MANLGYKLTLTSEASNSGPYYVVTYSTGSTWMPVVSGSPAYLPDTGSTAIIVIPSASYSVLAFNLNNGTGCELCDNDVVYVITGSFFTCCTPTLNSISVASYYSESVLNPSSSATMSANYTVTSGTYCYTCSYVVLERSIDSGSSWNTLATGSCESSVLYWPQQYSGGIDASYRIKTICGAVSSSASSTSSYDYPKACCEPTLGDITPSGSLTSSVFVNYTSSVSTTVCNSCSFVYAQSSSDGTNWSPAVTSSCISSSVVMGAPQYSGSTYYYRLYQDCSSGYSNYSATGSFTQTSGSTPPPAATASLNWFYTLSGGATGTMDIYVSGSAAVSRNYNSSGTTAVNVGDIIYVEVDCSACAYPNAKANAYTIGIINDAACGDYATSLSSYSYTVQPGDAGTTITLNVYSACDVGCL